MNKKIDCDPNLTHTLTVTITEKHHEFLKNKCVDKSELLKRLIDIRMEEPDLIS